MSAGRSISALTLVNAGSAVVSVANSVAMAWLFGTSTPAQVYLAASALLMIVQKIFMVGQFSDVFLPQYVRMRETVGGAKADRCFSALFNHVVVMLILAGAVLFALSPMLSEVIAPGFSTEEQYQVAQLLRGLIPTLLLVVMGGHLSIVGNARGWYGRFESYGLAGNLVGVVAFVCTARLLGVWSLVLSQLITQIVTVSGSLRYLCRNGYRHAWIWHEPGFKVWEVTGKVGLTGLYMVSTQIYAVAFTAALTLLPGGALAIYKYAESLYSRLSSLFLRPVSVVFFTDASVLAHREPQQLRARIQRALYHYALVYLCMLTLLFPAMRNLLGALWGSPRYGAAEIHQTTIYAWCLFALMIIDGTGLTYRRLNIALGDVNYQYYALTIVQMVMTVAAPALVTGLGVNGAPVVVAVNVTGFMAVGLLLLALRHRAYLAFFPHYTWKLIVAGVVPLVLAFLLPEIWPGLAYSGNHTLMGKMTELAKAAGIAVTSFGLVALAATILRVEEVGAMWRWLHQRTSLFARFRTV